MTVNDKFAKLAQALYYKTNTRSIDWKYDTQLGTYAKMAGRYISLGRGSNENGEPIETVSINSSEWTVLDEFNDESFWGTKPKEVIHFNSFFDMMAATHELAYRQAVGADKAIDDILDELFDDI